MQDETDESPPVLLAIRAIRAEIDGLIDAELERLLDGPPAADDPGGASDPADREAPPGLRAIEPDRDAPGGFPRGPERWHSRSSPPTAAGIGPPLVDRPVAGDPGEADRRLDALALRLEGRLRRSRDRAGSSPRPDDYAPDPGRSAPEQT